MSKEPKLNRHLIGILNMIGARSNIKEVPSCIKKGSKVKIKSTGTYGIVKDIFFNEYHEFTCVSVETGRPDEGTLIRVEDIDFSQDGTEVPY